MPALYHTELRRAVHMERVPDIAAYGAVRRDAVDWSARLHLT